MNHEIYKGKNLLEVLVWDGEKYDFQSGAHNRKRAALTAQAVTRAFELKGLAFERRSPEMLESDHRNFSCREVDENHVAVTTPIGVFRLRAKRATKGGPVTSLRTGLRITGFGDTASQDQINLPVSISGRLNPPHRWCKFWTFQPSHFTYEDGSISGFLGCHPYQIEWVTELDWPED